MTALSTLFLVGLALIGSLSWYPWPFTVISEPREAKPTEFFFSDTTMKKESTISLYFNVVVVEDSYVWFGKK